jgi:F-type H+-transporting ATPase subunit epsilon
MTSRREGITLRVLTPRRELLREDIARLRLPARDGVVGILPHHIDYVTVLVPGVATYERRDEGEAFLGIDEGLLVKRGADVLVATRNAVAGRDLGHVRRGLWQKIAERRDREAQARAAVARLETTFIQHFVTMEESADVDRE